MYRPIGAVASPITEPLRPERMRGVEARLVLEPRFAAAAAALAAGQLLWVVYHLQRAPAWHDEHLPELFTRRTASRPNPIGVTLVEVVAVEDSTITVTGMDAVDGSPVLDVKPYKPVYDQPPVRPGDKE